MLNNRKELVKRFLKEGFTYRTLSSFSDTQLKALSKKLFTEQVSEKDIKDKEKELADLYMAKAAELEEVETDEERNIETDPMGNPDIDIDGEPLLVELPQEVEEKFASKAQQKYLYSVNPAAAEKLASKMTKSDYEKLPEYVNEQEALESWITSLVESKELPTITKGNFIKTIKENLDGDVDSPYTIGTESQKDSFGTVMDIASEMVPPMTVEVDGFDDDGHMNGYLQNPEDEQIIELNICPSGNIKLNGNPVGGVELSETDRDAEGEYIGAPVDTAPVKTPTIAPTKPGEKKEEDRLKNQKLNQNLKLEVMTLLYRIG